jgi:hypothetical protein
MQAPTHIVDPTLPATCIPWCTEATTKTNSQPKTFRCLRPSMSFIINQEAPEVTFNESILEGSLLTRSQNILRWQQKKPEHSI